MRYTVLFFKQRAKRFTTLLVSDMFIKQNNLFMRRILDEIKFFEQKIAKFFFPSLAFGFLI